MAVSSAGLGERFDAARRRAFVGRQRELAEIAAVLDGTTAYPVVYVHGPGGIGKTMLLRQVGWRAEELGRSIRWYGSDTSAPVQAAPGDVLLVDEADPLVERGAALEALLRDVADGAVVVLAGRQPPPAMWRTDPGWREVVLAVAVSNLGADDGRELLRRRGVPEAAHSAALAFTHGHPLALALWSDVAAQSGAQAGAPGPAEHPEVLAALLAALVGTVPTPTHLAALAACSQVAVTTEPLLADLLDLPEARPLFEWLRGLSIIDVGPRGIYPHDSAREALARELRWRDPRARSTLHSRARAHYDRQLTGPDRAAARDAVFDAAFLHRDSPVLGPYLRHVTPGPVSDGLSARPATAAETPALLRAARAHLDPVEHDIVARWIHAQPGALTAVRDETGALTGWLVVVDLHRADAGEVAADPIAEAAHLHAAPTPPAPDETALLVRSSGDIRVHQATSPVQAHLTVHLVRRYLTTDRLAQVYVHHEDPDRWTAAMAYTDFDRVPGEAGLYVHDWRAVPPIAWMARLAGRELTGTADEPPAAATPLTHPELVEAVRSALRDIARPDRLADSTMVRARAVQTRLAAGTTPVERGRAVREALLAAAAVLEASPRDRRAYRALHHTYLQPAPTQAAAAELLDLPTTTYRRHLAAGVARLADLLWQDGLG